MVVCSRHREKNEATWAAGRGPALPGLAGEERRNKAGSKTPLLNLLGPSPWRGWPPKCGFRTSLWAQLCFPTRTGGKAHKSEAQGKAVINKKVCIWRQSLSLALEVTPNIPACAYTSASLLNLSQRHHTWDWHSHAGNSKGSCASKPSGEMWGQEVWGTDGALHLQHSKYSITKYPPSTGVQAMSWEESILPG